jgi:hypothetical protein
MIERSLGKAQSIELAPTKMIEVLYSQRAALDKHRKTILITSLLGKARFPGFSSDFQIFQCGCSRSNLKVFILFL